MIASGATPKLGMDILNHNKAIVPRFLLLLELCYPQNGHATGQKSKAFGRSHARSLTKMAPLSISTVQGLKVCLCVVKMYGKCSTANIINYNSACNVQGSCQSDSGLADEAG
jgi:hypothetical protein